MSIVVPLSPVAKSGSFLLLDGCQCFFWGGGPISQPGDENKGLANPTKGFFEI